MDKFLNYLSETDEFIQMDRAISERNTPILLNGISTESIPFFLDYIYSAHKQKVIFITPSDIAAQDIYRELLRYNSSKIIILQSDELKFYQIDAINRDNEFQRISCLKKIYDNDYDILILSIASLLRKYMPKKYYEKNIIDIKLSSNIDIYELTKKLVIAGYDRVRKIESKGQFSLRGSIIDIFPPDFSNPVRIEFFDDEVDSIRIFDLYSQVSIDKAEKVIIIPAREYIYPENIDKSLKNIENLLKDNTSEDIRIDIEKIQSKTYFKGLEKYIGFLYEEKDLSILQFIDKNCNIVLSEPNRVFEKIDNIYYEFFENYKSSLERGFALKGQDNIFIDKDSIMQKIYDYKLILTSEVTGNIKKIKTKAIFNFDVQSAPKYRGDINQLIVDINTYKDRKYKIVILLQEEKVIKNIISELESSDISAKYINSDKFDIESSDVFILKDNKTQGLILKKSKFAFITNNDIFFRLSKLSASRKRKNIKSERLKGFADLKKGDIVVHEVYGIGKFIGIEQKENDGIKKDYIKVSYKGGDFIYVPISQMDRVQRYIGNASDRISLTQLGSNQWKKQKQKAKKAVDEIAKYLIELYAERENQKGYAFSKDTVWQREFEALFPFEETQDQLKSIKDIKRDMENIRPMDRLICGDVGYGKTEVALRGIFKACMDQKQVAFLVPTTILAQQHYKTLSDRFENYPINVDVLSRFKTKKEQEKTVEKIKNGEVDVVIGTHRLLSKDVEFKNIGMLVIDEEQRFGVKHKEKIKQMKSNIDVLTLTATPIPRTLNMSLSGIRDMSVLEEPPNDRYPVITYVTEAREGIILDAIEREMARNGQVFFVYNSIENIDKMYNFIKKLVPSARIAIAHGQMSAIALEDIMMDYLEKKYDVLLCTTIIETGMDISNANTIIVYNADKMGLSQLYQLRGRVGRSSRQAYAYLMYEKDKVLTEIAQKRLKAIREFTEFGSGFRVAMMDLEIRGSGNILGEVQHGHIEEVGYDLYIKMLNDSFNRLKGKTVEEKVSTEVYLNVNAYIPDDYIEDEIQKMEIYKKIASINSKEDYFDIQAEIEDRFSDIPQEVENLLKISSIRSLGEKIRVVKISQKNRNIVYETKTQKFIQTLKTVKEDQMLKEIIEFMRKFL